MDESEHMSFFLPWQVRLVPGTTTHEIETNPEALEGIATPFFDGVVQDLGDPFYREDSST